MWRAFAICSALFLIIGAQAEEIQPSEIIPLIDTRTTISGALVVLPQETTRVVVSRYIIPAGASLAEHRHRFQRYAYVVTGTLRLTYGESGKEHIFEAGSFVVEAVDEWHQGANAGEGPLELLVIDQIGDMSDNVEPR